MAQGRIETAEALLAALELGDEAAEFLVSEAVGLQRVLEFGLLGAEIISDVPGTSYVCRKRLELVAKWIRDSEIESFGSENEVSAAIKAAQRRETSPAPSVDAYEDASELGSRYGEKGRTGRTGRVARRRP